MGWSFPLEHRVAAPLVVEAEQVAAAVARVAVEVGAHLPDAAVVREREPLAAAVEARLAGARVAPGHRPLDHGLLAVLDRVVDVPLAVDLLHRPLRVLADRPRALVRPEAGVVVHRVVGEMARNSVRIAGVEGFVVGADVVEECAHRRARRPETLSLQRQSGGAGLIAPPSKDHIEPNPDVSRAPGTGDPELSCTGRPGRIAAPCGVARLFPREPVS